MEYTHRPTIIGHSETRPRRDDPDARPRRRALVNRTRASSLHALARPAPVDDKKTPPFSHVHPLRATRGGAERGASGGSPRARLAGPRARRSFAPRARTPRRPRPSGARRVEPERAEPDFRWVHRWSPSQGAGRFRDANDAIPRGVDRARSIARYAPTLRPRDRGVGGATSTRGRG